MADKVYFIFRLNFFNVSAVPLIVEDKLREAYRLLGKTMPEIRRESGKVGVALFTEDKGLEAAIRRAADDVESEILSGENWTDYTAHRETSDWREMQALVHGPVEV